MKPHSETQRSRTADNQQSTTRLAAKRSPLLFTLLLMFMAGGVEAATIFSDDFSGSHPGAWSIGHDGGGGSYAWAWPNDYAHCYADPVGSEYYYPNNLHVYMERRGVSLSGYASATLKFYHIVDTEPTYDYFTVNVRDQWGTWHEMFRKSGATDPLNWTYKEIDMSLFAGQTGLYVQFRFDSDGSVSGSPYEGVYIDSVSLEATPPTTSFGGGVSDTATGSGISGATVQWGSLSRTTDSGGGYLFDQVPCGTATLTVSKSGYQTYTESYTPGCLMSQVKNIQLCEADGNNAYTGATSMTRNTSRTGKLTGSCDSVDWWVLNLSELGDLQVTLSVPSGQDFDLEVYGSNGSSLLGGSYNGAGQTDQVTIPMNYSGPYYIKVYTWGSYKGSYTLQNQIITRPDLQAPSFRVKASTALAGESFWIEQRIYNGGTATAGSSHARLYLSTDNDFDVSDDIDLGEKAVTSLSVGGEQWVRWDFTMPDFGDGAHSVWTVCVVDSRNEVSNESDENNAFKSNDPAFSASPSTQFGGSVSDYDTGAGVPAAAVTWGPYSTTADSGGSYLFGLVGCGAQTLTVTKDKYYTYSAQYTPTCRSSQVKNVVLQRKDDVPTDAVGLTRNGSGSAKLDYLADPVDWWVVSLSEFGDLRVTLDVPAGQDFDLEVYGNPNLAPLGGSYRGPGQNEEVRIPMTFSGSYYIKVYTAGASSGSYTVRNEIIPPNHAPQLTSVYVTPTSGQVGDVFNYYATFTDQDGDSPSMIQVNIDCSGGPCTHNMSYISGSPSSGAIYRYQGSPPAGGHSFYVYCEDGRGGSATSTVVSGPTVNAPPTIQILTGPSGTIGVTTATFSYSGTDSDGTIAGYETKLDGTVSSTANTSVTYNNLLDGPHTFQVRCFDNGNGYSGWATRSFTVASPPSNDLCVGAIALTDGSIYSESTGNATSAGDPVPGCANTVGKGVWFTFTPSATGPVTVSTCGSDFDTVLQVFSGSCGSLSPVSGGCNDDNGPVCATSAASVTFSGNASATYHIFAAGFNSASGALKIVATGSSSTSIAGIVTDSTTGNPIAGASVQWGGLSTFTDGNGAYYFSLVLCESRPLTVSKAGYQSQTTTFLPVCGSMNTRNVALSPSGSIVVSNVRASQTANTKIVRIYFDISGTFSAIPVSSSISTDNGQNYTLAGPSSPSVTPGNNRFLDWDAGTDYNNQYNTQMRVRVNAGAGGSASAAFTLDTRDQIRPIVQNVRSQYFDGNGRTGQHVNFLSGVPALGGPFVQQVTVLVNWNGKTPGTLHYICQTPFDGLSYTRNVNVSDWSPGGKLVVVAEAADGTRSLPFSANFDVITPPPLVASLLSPVLSSGNSLTYETPKFDLDIFHGRSGIVQGVPIPGETMEIQPKFKASAKVDGTGLFTLDAAVGNDNDITLNGTQSRRTDGKFGEAAGVEFGLDIQGSVEATYDPNAANWGVTAGYLGVNAFGEFASPPVYVYAPPPVYFRYQISGELFVGVNVLSLLPSSDLNPQFHLSSDDFPRITGIVGCGASSILALEGYAALSGKFEFSGPPAICQKLGIGGTVGIQLVLLGFETSVDIYSDTYWIVGPGAGRSLSLAASPGWQRVNDLMNRPESSVFRPLPRHYLKDSTPYGAFIVTSRIKPMFWGDPVSPNTPLTLQTNIFPYSEPALAVSGTNRILLFVTDNPARSDENRTELAWSKWTGSSWSNPTSVWDEVTADSAPTVKFLSDGRVMAVWQNERSTLTNGSTLNQALAGLEIAVGWLDPATNVWVCSNITDNATIDHSPQLAAGAGGTALLTWISNPSNSPNGSIAAPNIIRSRLWDGTTWQDPGDITTNARMVLWSTVAFDGTNGVVVIAIDLDDDQGTINDQELFGATFSAGAWSAFTRLTTNAVQDTRPQAAFDGAGHLLTAWFQSSNIVTHVGDLTLSNPDIVGVVGGASSAKDFRLISAPSGQATLVWEDVGSDNSGPDPFAFNYDYELNSWSEPIRLLHDTNILERSFAGAFDESGSLLLAFDQLHVATGTNGMQGPTNNTVDLVFLDYALGNDLALVPGSLRLATNNPSPGDLVEVAATLWNAGEKAATNIPIVFYNGASLIGTTQTVAFLPAGATTNVLVKWTVPSAAADRIITVTVDPDSVLNDRSRANNSLAITALKSDVAIGAMSVVNSTTTRRMINAEVLSGGNYGCGSPFQVIFRRGSINGPLLATVTVGAMPAGGRYDANFEWDLTGATFTNAFEPVYAIADPAGAVEDSKRNNNTNSVLVATTLDSDSDGLTDAEEFRFGSNATVPDTDHDGLLDGEEVHIYGTSPVQADSDGDGQTDGDEIVAGTDPLSIDDVFAIVNYSFTNGSASVTWLAKSNKTYQVVKSIDLLSWTNAPSTGAGDQQSSQTAVTNGPLRYIEPNLTTNGALKSFYRVCVHAVP